MKVWAAAATLAVALVMALPGSGRSEDAQARRYEHLMQKAAALREQADHLRSDAEAKGTLASARARAKALDAEADAVEKQARQAEPSGWPPQ